MNFITGSRQVMVTGASGFLGATIVDLAREAGWRVRAFDRSPRIPAEGVEMFLGDLGDIDTLRKACEGVSAVVHAAGLAHVFGPGAKDAALFNAVNEAGTGNVVRAALHSGVSNIALVSSVSVYGGYAGAKCDESQPCRPQGSYATSKWRGELKAIEQIGRTRGSLTILRFATIYGEGDRGNVAKLISSLDRRRFIWPGSGANRKSLIYKEDAARACLCALGRPLPGVTIFNVSPQNMTMKEIVSAICRALDCSIPRIEIPLSLVNAAVTISRRIGGLGQLCQRLQKFIHDDVYDGSKFEATFGFQPSISLSEGIRREVDFMLGKR